MKNLLCVLFAGLAIIIGSCKNESTVVTNENNPPPAAGWILEFHDYNIGTLVCTYPNPCSMDIVTDTINLTNNDSMRIFMSFHSVVNNSLTIFKVPYPYQLYNCVFPDSSYVKIDKVFASFKAKVLLDFGFEVGTRFTIDTLQIFKK